MLDWTSWKNRPTKRGYFLFAIRSCGDSYSCHTNCEVDYYDPELPTYAMGGREYDDKNGDTFEVVAWMELPPWPSHLYRINA